jgi:hypothetical protein
MTRRCRRCPRGPSARAGGSARHGAPAGSASGRAVLGRRRHRRGEPLARVVVAPTSPWAPSANLAVGRGSPRRASATAREHRFRGRHHHRHVAPFLHRALLDHAELGELLGEPVEDRGAALGVRHLAPAEHDRDLDLVLVAQEPLDVVLLRVVVVLGDLRAELDLADRDLLLVLLRLLDLLRLLVLVLRVVQHAAHRRARLGRDLDQVQVALLGEAERIGRLHHADLVALVVDHPDLGYANALVDPRRIPLGRAPVEPAGNRH